MPGTGASLVTNPSLAPKELDSLCVWKAPPA